MARDDSIEFRSTRTRKQRFKASTGEAGMSEVLDRFVAWFNHEPGARLPKRPPAPVPPDKPE